MNNNKLLSSKNFCLLPWMHLHAWPNGSVYPCCMAESKTEFGNLNTQRIADIINSEEFKNLRKNMLADKASSACARCYKLEAQANVFTLRQNSLNSFKQHLDEVVSNTNADGQLNNFKMRYLDIRFSNLCNLKCRTCGPDFSSSWQEELAANKNESAPAPLKIKNGFENILPYLDQVEEVYFAGGEPLVSDEHYQILEYWIKNKKTNIRIRYTTNFTHFKYKAYDLLELWSHFKDIRVAASLDAQGAQAEYLRKGTRWDQILINRAEMIKRCPDVYFEITPTVSVFNVFSLPEFHKNWIELGLIKEKNIRINYVLQPEIYSIQILPQDLKQKLKSKYLKYVELLTEPETKENFLNVIKFLEGADHKELVNDFIKKTKSVDMTRGENFYKIFPELVDLK